MRTDNSAHIITAAHQRSQATRRKAVATLRTMDNTGATISFDAVARQAGVSRSWLYAQPDIRAEIERLRRRHPPTTAVPDRQRPTDPSLHRRLQIATDRIQTLEADNKRLRQALAEALGQRRADPHRDTPTHQLSQPPQPAQPATS